MTNNDMDTTPDVDTNWDNFIRDLVELGDSMTPTQSGIELMMGVGCGDDELDRKIGELTMTHFGRQLTDSMVDDIVEQIDGDGDFFND